MGIYQSLFGMEIWGKVQMKEMYVTLAGRLLAVNMVQIYGLISMNYHFYPSLF